MAAAVKLATSEELSPELRDFLDRVIVPALLRKYLAETVEEDFDENFLALEPMRALDSRAIAPRRSASDGERL